MVTGLLSSSLEKSQPQLYALIPDLEKHTQHHQKTIANVASCQGIGVHSGSSVTVTLHPAVAGSGITFVRTDLEKAEVKALWQTVTDTRNCTTIGNSQGVTISTIEHLMAALAANGIDNVWVEIDGPELPIMDGSAQPFMALVEEAGVKEYSAPRQVIRVLKTISVEEGD